MDPITVAFGLAKLLHGLFGRKDYPKLKDEEGNWLPLHYATHYRAVADDLSDIWRDNKTICDNATGLPVARWNKSKQKVQPVTGFTIQGLPVYADVDENDPVWHTTRPVPPAFGTPGSSGEHTVHRGGSPVLFYPAKMPYLRGRKIVDAVGYFGPLSAPLSAPPAGAPPVSGPGGPGFMLIGAATLAALGMWFPALLLGGVSLLSSSGGLAGASRGSGGTPPTRRR